MASSEWHWEQGNKYAVESIKTALLVNGAAGIALMTFANVQNFPSAVIYPLFSFAIGAMLSALAFLAAYVTQLEYGNAERLGIAEQDRDQIWKRGQRWNKFAIALMLLSVGAFSVGVIWAALVLRSLVEVEAV